MKPLTFSPRARGCSWHADPWRGRLPVFPACAGMFLSSSHVGNRTPCFPRVRGDVPLPIAVLVHSEQFSPRARGCSAERSYLPRPTPVFPACAGMFLAVCICLGDARRFPRVRGDVPGTACSGQDCIKFSPRARGCSAWSQDIERPPLVFPACAGMFRRRNHRF